jgi:hypothetical protein
VFCETYKVKSKKQLSIEHPWSITSFELSTFKGTDLKSPLWYTWWLIVNMFLRYREILECVLKYFRLLWEIFSNFRDNNRTKMAEVLSSADIRVLFSNRLHILIIKNIGFLLHRTFWGADAYYSSQGNPCHVKTILRPVQGISLCHEMSDKMSIKIQFLRNRAHTPPLFNNQLMFFCWIIYVFVSIIGST